MSVSRKSNDISIKNIPSLSYDNVRDTISQLNVKSNLFLFQSETYKKAIECYRLAISMANTIPENKKNDQDRDELILLKRNLAKSFILENARLIPIGKFTDIIENSNEAINILNEIPDDKKTTHEQDCLSCAYIDKAQAQVALHHYHAAIENFQKAIDKLSSNNFYYFNQTLICKRGLIFVLSIKNNDLFNKKKFNEIIDCTNEIIKTFNSIPEDLIIQEDKNYLQHTYDRQSYAYFALKNYKEAINCSEKAIMLSNEIPDDLKTEQDIKNLEKYKKNLEHSKLYLSQQSTIENNTSKHYGLFNNNPQQNVTSSEKTTPNDAAQPDHPPTSPQHP